nr:immunoglobulin heavy chain junction region [Mus musculus]
CVITTVVAPSAYW